MKVLGKDAFHSSEGKGWPIAIHISAFFSGNFSWIMYSNSTWPLLPCPWQQSEKCLHWGRGVGFFLGLPSDFSAAPCCLNTHAFPSSWILLYSSSASFEIWCWLHLAAGSYCPVGPTVGCFAFLFEGERWGWAFPHWVLALFQIYAHLMLWSSCVRNLAKEDSGRRGFHTNCSRRPIRMECFHCP